MTILTIEMQDSETEVISNITSIVNKAGGKIEIDHDDDLTRQEFDLLQESYKEALMIKDGLKKGIPASELWND